VGEYLMEYVGQIIHKKTGPYPVADTILERIGL